MIRVLVSAASEITRAGLQALLTASPALAVVGSAPDTATAAQQVEDLQPDVVLLELEPVHVDDEAMMALPVLGVSVPPPALVIMADELPSAWMAAALRCGVRAFLPYQAMASEIVAAIEAAAAGLVTVHPDIMDMLLSAVSSAPHLLTSAVTPTLTRREVEVLNMLAEGLGNKTIAWRLGISEHTVKFHISTIFTKLNASSRTEAVTLGIRLGLVIL